MTVAELIKRLEVFEPDTRVVTPGFDESNYADVETVELIVVQFRDDLEVGHSRAPRPGCLRFTGNFDQLLTPKGSPCSFAST